VKQVNYVPEVIPNASPESINVPTDSTLMRNPGGVNRRMVGENFLTNVSIEI